MASEVRRRRFAAPWSVEETLACFVVKDFGRQKLAYVYYEEEPGRRSARPQRCVGEDQNPAAPEAQRAGALRNARRVGRLLPISPIRTTRAPRREGGAS